MKCRSRAQSSATFVSLVAFGGANPPNPGKSAVFRGIHCPVSGVIDKRSQNIRSFPCDEPRFEHHPERLAARKSRHQGAQDRRARWPPEIAIENRSLRVAHV